MQIAKNERKRPKLSLKLCPASDKSPAELLFQPTIASMATNARLKARQKSKVLTSQLSFK
jgi:hypothetical protein